MLSNILDRISFWSLFVVIVLLPIFFLPFTSIPVETSKGLLLVVGLVISVIFWIAARFSDGKFKLPKSWILYSSVLILLVFLVSALFSSSIEFSLFGTMFDTGTFYYMLAAVLLMFMCSMVLKDEKHAKKIFWGVIISSVVLFVFQVLRIFMPDALSLGILGGKTDNLLGSWNAFGLFTGFTTIISLFILEFSNTSKLLKWLLSIFIVFSLLLSVAVNLTLIWQLLGVFALIIFVYKVSSYAGKSLEEREKKTFPLFSFMIVMVSLFFFMSGQFIGSLLPNSLGLTNMEVRPSFSVTMSVTGSALMKNPILGVGPNNFSQVWAMYKPDVINSTQFWDTSFSFGSGLLPTFASTTGILGILAWLAFAFFFILTGIRALFSSLKNNTNWEAVIFFVAAFYLFVASFFYSTGSVIFLLAFAFTGIFIGLYSYGHQNRELAVSFLDDPRKSFFSILLLVVLMITSAAVGFKYIERLASVSYFSKTISAKTIPEAEDAISKAISLYQNDLYLRTYAQVYLTKISSIVSKGASSLSDTDKTDLQSSFDQAVNGAQSAVNYNKNNYVNYTLLGSVYDTVASLGVKDAPEKAIEAYNTASTLNPLNPGIKLSLAQSSLSANKTEEAKNYATESIKLKPDYINALVVMSQIEKSLGNTSSAISYAEQALTLAPDNKELSQYVNSLKNGTSTNAPVISNQSSTETPAITNTTKTDTTKKKK